MTKLPWSKFFWTDYDADEGLRVCSLASQGLWMRMLCLMARATPVGELRIGSEPCTTLDLARSVGEREETVADLLSELQRREVFSVTRSGVLYCRRMRKQAEISRKRSENGKLGGRVSRSKQKTSEICLSKTEANDKAKTKPQKPEARVQSPDKEKNTKKETDLFDGGADPPKPSIKDILGEVLDSERITAVIDHRKKKKAPLTAHAARLLVNELTKCSDANAAADLMILRGWQSLKADWVANELPGERGRPGYMKHARGAQ